MSYAEGTSVPVERSKAEIDGMLQRHGATQRMQAVDDDRGLAVVGFTMGGRQIRLEVPLPKIASFSKPAGARSTWNRERVYEQACRERWRAVALLTKSKLEAIALGISSVEREFLADLALPNGKTVHTFMREGIAEAYASGKMGTLPMLGPAK